MVQRDYVRRKSQTKKNSSRLMPNLMILIAIILIILFSAILYFVSTNKADKPAELPKAKTESPAQTLPEQPQERWTYLKELESPNASSNPTTSSVVSERQQILDSFVNNTRTITTPPTAQTSAPTPAPAPTQTKPTQSTVPPVAAPTPVSTPAPAAPTPSKWILQCGAFKDKSNADTLRAQLAMSGINGNITSGQLYRVTTGPYNSKSDADKAVNSLKSNGITNCIVSAK